MIALSDSYVVPLWRNKWDENKCVKLKQKPQLSARGISFNGYVPYREQNRYKRL